MQFWRTKEWLKYLLNSKHGMVYKDHSFFIDNKFVPLVQEGQEFFSPGFDDDKKVLQNIKELAHQHNIKRIEVNTHIKSYLNISGWTCILNLNEINPSKGHKSAIKIGQKHLDYEIMLYTDQFMIDYFRIAGKETRPEKTFQLMQEWIQQGYGTLLKAIYQGNTSGYIYILHYENCAYYFMSCVEPEYKQYNVSHYLQSVAFDILRQKCIKTYELGEQVYNSLIYQPSEKERNISQFKRNFGGNIVISQKSEYFFNDKHFKETMLNRINKYWEYENENIINISKIGA